MKAKQNPDRKRNEINIISAPLIAISFHKGDGTFSIHDPYRKNLPLVLIMVSRGAAISVKTSAPVPVEIHSNRCQLFFEQGLSPKISYKGSGKWEFFKIRISPVLLEELPHKVCPVWDSFMKKVGEKRPAILTGSPIYYKNALKDTAYSLLQAKFAEPNVREKYFNIKVQEILLHVMHELLLPTATDPAITGRERMVALKIKQILDRAQTSRDLTMLSLVDALGINETTLKQSFKKVMGCTIYRYYLDKKMNLARQLLKKGQSVTDVAIAAGYSTIGHFSYQFKKYFGTAPINFRSEL